MNRLCSFTFTCDRCGSAFEHDIPTPDHQCISTAVEHDQFAEIVMVRCPSCGSLIQDAARILTDKILERLEARTEQTELAADIGLSDYALGLGTINKHPILKARLLLQRGILFSRNLKDNRAQNLEKAISLLELAAGLVPQDNEEYLWAKIKLHLAVAYKERLEGNRADAIEQAIGIFEQALTVFQPQRYLDEWTETMNSLGDAYWNRRYGDRKANIEKAIEIHQAVVESLPKESHLLVWAETKKLLGNAFLFFPVGDPTQNIKKAITHYEEALAASENCDQPQFTADILMNLANAHLSHAADHVSEHQELAITFYRRACELCIQSTNHRQLAKTLLNLSSAYSWRVQGDRSENFETAIALTDQALKILTRADDPEWWALVMIGHAYNYGGRRAGDRSANLECAIEACAGALEIFTFSSYPYRWALTMSILGELLSDRIKGDKSENIEKAIGAFEQALKYFSPDNDLIRWANALGNLGSILINRIQGDCAENQEEAIRCLETVTNSPIKQCLPMSYGICLLDLARAYRSRRRGNKTANLENAMRIAKMAQVVFKELQHVSFLNYSRIYMASLYLLRKSGSRSANLERAILLCRKVLMEVTTEKNAIYWCDATGLLANAYSLRSHGANPQDLETAAQFCWQVLDVMTLTMDPWRRLEVLTLFFEIMIQRTHYERLHEACREVERLDDFLRAQELTQKSVQHRIDQMANLMALVTYACAQNNLFGPALEWLERSKTRALRERLARDRSLFLALKSEDHEEFQLLEERLRFLEAEQQGTTPCQRPFLEIAEESRGVMTQLERLTARIRQYQPDFLAAGLQLRDMIELLPPSGRTAFVAFNITMFGTAILILTGTRAAPIRELVINRAFTEKNLRKITSRWVVAARDFKDRPRSRKTDLAWGSKIAKIMGEVERCLWAPVRSVIEKVAPVKIVLIPHRSLHILPLHLINRTEEGRRRYLFNDYEISYLPSFELGNRDQTRTTTELDSLLTITDPTDDLHWVQEETKHIGDFFPETTILTSSAAVIPAVKAAAAHHRVLHFACHGIFDLINPYGSGLQMAVDRTNLPAGFGARVAQASTVVTGKGRIPVCEIKSLGDDEVETVTFSSRGQITNCIRTLKDSRKLVLDPHELQPKGEIWTLGQILRDFRIPNTELVVLSACESGVVEAEKLPDEYIGLPAGFLAAGARTVVSSLWNVDDESTCQLMKSFYRNLIQYRQPPAQALRNAQLSLQRQTRYSNPYYWGAFLVSG